MSKILSIDENKTWIRRGYPSLMAGIAVVTDEEIWFARIDVHVGRTVADVTTILHQDTL